MSERPDFLASLEKDIHLFKDAIREASESIVRDEISAYPIFVATKADFPVGELILDREELDTEWSIRASTAEDFIREGIIPVEKAKFFITQYKSPAEFICLFVVPDAERANFIFVPYS